jgi:hypothetical protein
MGTKNFVCLQILHKKKGLIENAHLSNRQEVFFIDGKPITIQLVKAIAKQ